MRYKFHSRDQGHFLYEWYSNWRPFLIVKLYRGEESADFRYFIWHRISAFEPNQLQKVYVFFSLKTLKRHRLGIYTLSMSIETYLENYCHRCGEWGSFCSLSYNGLCKGLHAKCAFVNISCIFVLFYVDALNIL